MILKRVLLVAACAVAGVNGIREDTTQWTALEAATTASQTSQLGFGFNFTELTGIPLFREERPELECGPMGIPGMCLSSASLEEALSSYIYTTYCKKDRNSADCQHYVTMVKMLVGVYKLVVQDWVTGCFGDFTAEEVLGSGEHLLGCSGFPVANDDKVYGMIGQQISIGTFWQAGGFNVFYKVDPTKHFPDEEVEKKVEATKASLLALVDDDEGFDLALDDIEGLKNAIHSAATTLTELEANSTKNKEVIDAILEFDRVFLIGKDIAANANLRNKIRMIQDQGGLNKFFTDKVEQVLGRAKTDAAAAAEEGEKERIKNAENAEEKLKEMAEKQLKEQNAATEQKLTDPANEGKEEEIKKANEESIKKINDEMKSGLQKLSEIAEKSKKTLENAYKSTLPVLQTGAEKTKEFISTEGGRAMNEFTKAYNDASKSFSTGMKTLTKQAQEALERIKKVDPDTPTDGNTKKQALVDMVKKFSSSIESESSKLNKAFEDAGPKLKALGEEVDRRTKSFVDSAMGLTTDARRKIARWMDSVVASKSSSIVRLRLEAETDNRKLLIDYEKIKEEVGPEYATEAEETLKQIEAEIEETRVQIEAEERKEEESVEAEKIKVIEEVTETIVRETDEIEQHAKLEAEDGKVVEDEWKERLKESNDEGTEELKKFKKEYIKTLPNDASEKEVAELIQNLREIDAEYKLETAKKVLEFQDELAKEKEAMSDQKEKAKKTTQDDEAGGRFAVDADVEEAKTKIAEVKQENGIEVKRLHQEAVDKVVSFFKTQAGNLPSSEVVKERLTTISGEASSGIKAVYQTSQTKLSAITDTLMTKTKQSIETMRKSASISLGAEKQKLTLASLSSKFKITGAGKLKTMDIRKSIVRITEEKAKKFGVSSKMQSYLRKGTKKAIKSFKDLSAFQPEYCLAFRFPGLNTDECESGFTFSGMVNTDILQLLDFLIPPALPIAPLLRFLLNLATDAISEIGFGVTTENAFQRNILVIDKDEEFKTYVMKPDIFFYVLSTLGLNTFLESFVPVAFRSVLSVPVSNTFTMFQYIDFGGDSSASVSDLLQPTNETSSWANPLDLFEGYAHAVSVTADVTLNLKKLTRGSLGVYTIQLVDTTMLLLGSKSTREDLPAGLYFTIEDDLILTSRNSLVQLCQDLWPSSRFGKKFCDMPEVKPGARFSLALATDGVRVRFENIYFRGMSLWGSNVIGFKCRVPSFDVCDRIYGPNGGDSGSSGPSDSVFGY